MFPIPMVSGQPQLPATALKDTEINKRKNQNQPPKKQPKKQTATHYRKNTQTSNKY